MVHIIGEFKPADKTTDGSDPNGHGCGLVLARYPGRCLATFPLAHNNRAEEPSKGKTTQLKTKYAFLVAGRVSVC